jgi:hypothetical protein
MDIVFIRKRSVGNRSKGYGEIPIDCFRRDGRGSRRGSLKLLGAAFPVSKKGSSSLSSIVKISQPGSQILKKSIIGIRATWPREE